MKYFFTIKDGRIDNIIQSAESKPPAYGVGWHKAPKDWYGAHGDPIEHFDPKTWRKFTEDELVKQGKLIDNRGIWYDKITCRKKEIKDYGVKAHKNWTQVAPIKNEIYQFFNGERWIVNENEKRRAEREKRLCDLKAQVDDAERKIIRPLRAMQKNRATEADLKRFNDLDTFIESLRPEITHLEEELHSD